jgi:hypothetical protein
MTAPRPLIVVRAVWGAFLLGAVARPGRHRARARPIVRLGAGLLGLRHIVEAAAMAGDAEPPLWSIGVDATHAASMVALAVVDPGLRRDALVSGAGAGALAAVSAYQRAG